MEPPVPSSQRGNSRSPVQRSLNGGSTSLPSYLPHLENKIIIEDDLQAFESCLLSMDTAVRCVGFDSRGRIIDKLFDDAHLESYLRQSENNAKKAEFFFVNRYLIKKGVLWPEDASRLRLSPSAFKLLCSYFELSPTFLSSISNIHHPSARACPLPSRILNDTLDFWFILPVRVQVHCSDRKSHASYSTGKSQMNPLNYLHLANTKPEVDIRGSQIGIYFRFDQEKLRGLTLVINFQDGRWRRVVEEPIMRVKETLEDAGRGDSGKDPFYLQTVFLTSILRWWSNALNSFNDQLIAYEEKMLAEEQSSNMNFSTLNSKTSRALHCMTAHLRRYGSELVFLSDVVQDIKRYNIGLHEKFVKYGIRPSGSLEYISRSIDQITTHLSSISQFRKELQLKTDNVLSLLVDNTQIMNERLLIENSKAMQSILIATQNEAEQSRQLTAKSQELTNEINKILHNMNEETKASLQMAKQTQRLSEEMMKDSVYMKTIALLTVLFLPGTSFAAILSMPFFDDKWMQNVRRFWLWIALTVPTTALCFAFYVIWGRKEARRKRVFQDRDEKV